MPNIVLTLIFAAYAWLLIVFFWPRGKTFLLFLQQEEYDNIRFLSWWWKARAFDRWGSALAIAGAATAVFFRPDVDESGWAMPLTSLWVAAPLLGGVLSLPVRKQAKKPLAMTARAKRIFLIFLLSSLALIGANIAGNMNVPARVPMPYVIASWFVGLAFLFQLPPFLLVLANWLLKPFEALTQRKYRREAKAKLAELDPFIIAITGSYGKTSTKHILNHILSSVDAALATPGSVNTEMGIARIVREKLDARHKYFIVEMGAYGPGSIERLCRLAPPNLGLITAIGHAHYERFKSLETVADAKFELAEAVAANHPEDGCTIINLNAMPEGTVEAQRARSGRLILVGRGTADDLSVILKDCIETADGLTVTLTLTGPEAKSETRDIAFFAPIWGQHQADNIMMAVATALQLGYPPETIKAALKTCPQVRHRQEVTLADVGPSVIDDAYNSNPTGFASALDTLDVLGSSAGRKVLITPGMVELGAAHDEKHLELGRKAGTRVDLALIVGPERIPTFMQGFRETAPGTGLETGPNTTEIKTFPRQKDAEDWYKANAGDGDVVLFENNLPDLYEAKVRF